MQTVKIGFASKVEFNMFRVVRVIRVFRGSLLYGLKNGSTNYTKHTKPHEASCSSSSEAKPLISDVLVKRLVVLNDSNFTAEIAPFNLNVEV